MTKMTREILNSLSSLYPLQDYEEQAIDEALKSEPHWIPCSERLPEYGIAVLTFNRDDEYEVNHIIDEEDGEWFWEGVKAWQPLPEPYKEDKA